MFYTLLGDFSSSVLCRPLISCVFRLFSMYFNCFRLLNDCEELAHALTGLDFLWRHLRPEALLYPESDVTGLEFETSVYTCGLKPWMISNIGSALSIVKVNTKIL